MPSPVRLRTRRASSQLASRAGSGQASGCAGRRRAEDQVGLAGFQRAGQQRKLPRVEAAVAVAEAHQVGRGGQQPGVGGCPEPRAASGTTVAPSDRTTSPEPSVEPLSTTIGRKPSGILSRIHGNASASFRHGKITSAITAATLLPMGPAVPVEPYKPQNSSSGHPVPHLTRVRQGIYDNPARYRGGNAE
jgi:hypothetical protein